MKDMAAMQPGMAFYAEMPDSYNLIVNTEHKLVKEICAATAEALDSKVQPVEAEIEAANAEITRLRDAAKAAGDKKDAETDKQLSDLEKKVSDLRASQEKTIAEYAATQPRVKQLIDLALLGNGLLRGGDLAAFISRSVSLL
jgi:molecular chaperone HtpG